MWKININIFGPQQPVEDPSLAAQAQYEAEKQARLTGERADKKSEWMAVSAEQGRFNNTSTNWRAVVGRGNGPEAPGQKPQPDPGMDADAVVTTNNSVV